MFFFWGFLLLTINFNYLELLQISNNNLKYISKGIPIFFSFLIFFFHKKKINYKIQPLINFFSPLILIYFIGGVSFIWSHNSFLSIERSIFSILILYSIFFYVLILHYQKKNIINQIKIISLIAIFFAFFFTATTFKINVSTFNFERLGNYLIHPNALGLLIGITIILYFNDILLKKNKKIDFIIILILFYILLLTNSRSSMLLTLLVISLSIFFSLRKRGDKFLLIYIIILFFIFILSTNFIDNFDFVKSFIFRGQEIDDLLTLNNRTKIWDAISLNGFDFIFGHGYMMLSEKQYLFIDTREIDHAHNGFFQIYASLGFLGLVIFLLFLKKIFQYFKNIKDISIKLNYLTISAFFIISNFSISSVAFHFFPHIVFFKLVICFVILSNEKK